LAKHQSRLSTTLKQHIDASHKVVDLDRGGILELLIGE